MQIWLTTFQTLQAAETNVQLPATFVRIYDVSKISAESVYLIAGVTQNQRVNLMKAKGVTKKSPHLLGLINDNGLTDNYECNNSILIWRIIPNAEGTYYIQSAATGEYVSRSTKAKLDLVLVEKVDQDLCRWNVSINTDGVCSILSPQEPTRGLSAQFYSSDEDWFRNYNSPEKVYLYKLSESFGDISGNATLPADGSRVTLSCGNKVWQGATSTSADATDFQLTDGSIAEDGDFSSFICRHESGSTFTLKDEATQSYLSADLSLTSTKTVWQISNGYITTQCNDGETRTLCYVPSQKSWRVLTTDEATKLDANGAEFLTVAPAPQSHTNAKGVTTLSGGWSATKLANIGWTGTKCLDLTQISLPKHLLPFATTAETQNLPIFVAQAASSAIPTEWNFVVSCANGDNVLLRATQLTDKLDFFTDRTIRVPKGMLTYKRSTTKGSTWQTLCLPFDADAVPSGFTAYQVDSLAANEATLTAATSLKGGRAYVLRTNDGTLTGGSNVLIVTNAECTLTTDAATDSPLRGTFSEVTLTGSSSKTCMLHPEKEMFQAAASGSKLPPFRVALHPAGTSPQKIRLNISQAKNTFHK